MALALGCGDDATTGSGSTQAEASTGSDSVGFTSSTSDSTSSTTNPTATESTSSTTDLIESTSHSSETDSKETDVHETDSSTDSSSSDGHSDASSSSGEIATLCGDGVVEGLEACDDGNNEDNDGCAADCTDPCAGPPASTIYVDHSAPSGGDGTSWDSAYNHPHDALAGAAPNTEIWIAGGVYFPLQDNLPIGVLQDCVDVYGGFVGTETTVDERPGEGQAVTVLEGDINGDDDDFFWGENAHHIFVAFDISNVIIDRVTMRRGRAIGTEQRGGGLYVENSNIVLRGGTVDNNSGDEGGGVFVGNGSTLWTYGTVLRDNRSPYGGAIAVDASSRVVAGEGTHFLRNDGGEEGGAVHVRNGVLEMSNTTVERNTSGATNGPFSEGLGGGVFVQGGDSLVMITETVFIDNDADSGGAIHSMAGDEALTVIQSTFTDNSAFAGGAMFVRGANVSQSTFDLNVAVDSGGAIFNSIGATLYLEENTFTGNTATSGGGAVAGNGPPIVEQCTFENNETSNFGGGAIDAPFGLTSNGSTYVANRAPYGGAISIGSTANDSTLMGDRFEDNVAFGAGGALSTEGTLDPGMVSIDHAQFIGNTAGTQGGAMTAFVPYRVYDSVFVSNVANEGGGMYTASIGSASIMSTSFFDNTALDPESAGGMHLRSLTGEPVATVRNVTMWGNGEDVVGEDFADPQFTCTQEGIEGADNVLASANPFTLGPAGELFVEQTSNCIDQGDDVAADVVYDAIYDQGDDYWMSLSNAADGTLDSGTVDPTHHHQP